MTAPRGSSSALSLQCQCIPEDLEWATIGRRGTHPRVSLSPMPLLGFDIETANIIELAPGEGLEAHGPLNITVAATHISGGEELLWLSVGADGVPQPVLDRDQARQLLAYLARMQSEGHRVVAWNGLSFDMRWLGHAAGDRATAARVAMKLYDPMFQFFKMKGFAIGLAAAARGLGITMTKLMDGALAPQAWRDGKFAEVSEYVKGDARMTVEIALAIERAGGITWITKKGSPSSVRFPRLRTVQECMADPMPDQSWLDDPWPQAKFTSWME